MIVEPWGFDYVERGSELQQPGPLANLIRIQIRITDLARHPGLSFMLLHISVQDPL